MVFSEEYLVTEKKQLLGRLQKQGIEDDAVLAALRAIPREAFMPDYLYSNAYVNAPFPIEAEQTISQPYIVALMTQALEVEPSHKVLEIGTGSGYQAAILSLLCKDVYTIERHKILLNKAESRFHTLALSNIHTKLDNGTLGWQEEAPFDRIIITAAAKTLPEPLLDQLKDGGIMVVPVENAVIPSYQNLLKITKKGKKTHTQDLGAVQFVPLVEA